VTASEYRHRTLLPTSRRPTQLVACRLGSLELDIPSLGICTRLQDTTQHTTEPGSDTLTLSSVRIGIKSVDRPTNTYYTHNQTYCLASWLLLFLQIATLNFRPYFAKTLTQIALTSLLSRLDDGLNSSFGGGGGGSCGCLSDTAGAGDSRGQSRRLCRVRSCVVKCWRT
jgi:hypothetical protein